MTRGKQKIDAQRRSAEKNQKSKGSQLEARAEGLKIVCPVCKVSTLTHGPLPNRLSPLTYPRLPMDRFTAMSISHAIRVSSSS
jgi:hypothetical protein